MPSPTGFEARPRHRARLPSLNSVVVFLRQGTVETDLAFVAQASSQADAVKVLQNLNAALAAQADHISDLLRDLPGVDVGGAHSLNQRITEFMKFF